MLDTRENIRRDGELEVRLARAKQIARQAGALARGWFEERDILVIEHKETPQDLVSQADRDVEEFIRRELRSSFPQDGVLGEEAGQENEGAGDFLWVVDPIDGTTAFLHGQPNWAVSIALVYKGEIVVGVIEAPVLGEFYHASLSSGAFLNGRRLQINPTDTLTSNVIAYGATEKSDPAKVAEFIGNLYRAGGVVFRVGSAAIMLGYVASGKCSGYYDPGLSSWDCYAGLLIVRESGGQSSFSGSSTERGELWAGNSTVFRALTELSGR